MLTYRFILEEWCPHLDPTMEDLVECPLEIDGKEETIKILDTCWQEQYPELQDHWIRDSKYFMLVYDIKSMASFEYIKTIYTKLLRHTEDREIQCILVGNKSDLFSGIYSLDRSELQTQNMKDLVFGYLREIEFQFGQQCEDNGEIKYMPHEIKEICQLYVFQDGWESTFLGIGYEIGHKLAESWGISFIETSAKTGNNVNKAFQSLFNSAQTK